MKRPKKRIKKNRFTKPKHRVKEQLELKLKPADFYYIECASQYHIHEQHYTTEQDAIEDTKIIGCKDAKVIQVSNA